MRSTNVAARAAGDQPVVQCRPRAADVQRARGRRREPDPHAGHRPSMLIGAHVSTAGGLVKAHGRGVERGCDAIQIFNQSPRMWRPTSAGRTTTSRSSASCMDAARSSRSSIHAVYLINRGHRRTAEIRKKSLASLTHALRMGDAIGADGVVLHPGSAVGRAARRGARRASGEALRQALAESEGCRAAAREHRRRRRHARALVRGARAS